MHSYDKHDRRAMRGGRKGPPGEQAGDGFALDWERGGGRHGGRRRMFDNGELRLILLALIDAQPRHGYDLIRAIEERSGGAYAPSPGVVYPTLTLLNDMGLIGERETEGARKLFAISPEGKAHLAAHGEEVAATGARLDALAANRDHAGAVPLRRAMHNLRSVLMNRLSEGRNKDLVHDAVALIDEAARKIERL